MAPVTVTSTGLRVRDATMDDARLLFEWRNDPATRTASLTRGDLHWESHLEWLRGALDDAGRVLLIVQSVSDDGVTPLGVCRFDSVDQTIEVSITVAPEQRGAGRGRQVLTAGIEAFAPRRGGRELTAQIRVDNPASIALFTRAGFVATGSSDGVGRYRYEP